MSVRNAAKFFQDNFKRHLSARNDPVMYNLNQGLLTLVEELHSEIGRLHQEIAHLSQQVGQLARR
jgi:hypothetical protein